MVKAVVGMRVATTRDRQWEINVVRRQGRARRASRASRRRLRRAKGKIRELEVVRKLAPEMVLEVIFVNVAAVAGVLLQEVVASQNGGIRRRAPKVQG